MLLFTKRLTLRPAGPDDVEFLVGLWTDPEVMRFMGGPREPGKVKAAVLEGVPDAWVVHETATGDPVGDCFLLDKEIDGTAEKEIIYLVARKHWGKGYAPEAAAAVLEHAALPRVVALIEPDNAASARVAEKIGLRHERDVDRGEGRTMRLFASPGQEPT
jgi:RimJ/RimL family protein N-acetyltransferase